MTRRWLGVVVTMLFCLLALAAPANTACAWILWDQTSGQEWETRNGFSDETSCKRAAQRWLSKLSGKAVGSDVEV